MMIINFLDKKSTKISLKTKYILSDSQLSKSTPFDSS